MVFCGRKKIPPMWFILDAPQTGKAPVRQGPYSRETFIQLMAQGRVTNTQMIWTSERIFPNASKPRSSKLVRISDWRRLDQLPDPVLRKLQAEAQQVMAAANAHLQPMQNVDVPSNIPPIPTQQQQQQQPPMQYGQQPQQQPPPMQYGQQPMPYGQPPQPPPPTQPPTA